MPVIPEPGRWRQEDQSEVLGHFPLRSQFKASLGYKRRGGERDQRERERERERREREKEREKEKLSKIH